MPKQPGTCLAAVMGLSFALSAGSLPAAPPEQYRSWGTAGPQFPPAPAGWREATEDEAAEAAWPASPAEQQRGYLVFVRDPFLPVSRQATGLPAERAAGLRAFAARGEYEPVSFALHALRPLAGVRVELGELKAAGGAAIPADQVDVRIIRHVRTQVRGKSKAYCMEPMLLERQAAFDVPAGRTQQVWITLHVPDSAAPGRYEAEVRTLPKDAPAGTIKLALDVLPFALPQADIEQGTFYPRPPADDTMLRRQLIDIREHGCVGVDPAFGAEVVTRDQSFGEDDVKAVEAASRRLIRAQREAFGPFRRPVTFEVGHQIAYYWDTKANWFVFWPHSPKIEADLLKAVDVVRNAARAEGVTDLRIYALDEAGAHNLLDEAVYYYGFLKRQRPDLIGWTSIGGGIAMGLDEIGQLSGVVDMLSTNRFTPEIAKLLTARAKPYGIYNGAGPTVAGARFFHGFWCFKSAAAQIAQWCYFFGNSVFEGSGIRQDDEGYVYMAGDGPLPSIPWEAVREGIDDYRYLQRLWGLIASARASGKGEAKAAARSAEEALAGLLGRIGWGFQAVAGEDRTPPPPPGTLRKWRRAVAEEIVRLLPLAGAAEAPVAAGPAAAAGTKPPPRADPLSWPWAAPAAEKLQFGPELLPPGDFEPGKTLWQVQAWKGKGAGAADEKVRHSGQRSMRVEIPADVGNDAITVLTWPSWGASKIDVSLDGGRVYELSAWMKWQGRTTPPPLRIALPEGGAKTASNGQDPPGAAGWQRLWTRVQPYYPVIPKYLAVWIQGPGTVWVDDLSLREVIPPPLRMSLDQAAYDGLDAVGVAMVAVEEHAAPAAVRFTISRRGGAQMARRTCSFRGETVLPAGEAQGSADVAFAATVELRPCRVVFSPAALPAGEYEATAELLDAAGKPIATQSAAFERLAE